MALRNYASVKLERLPRMADFAKWVVAAEPALPWKEGTFLRVYDENRFGAIETTLEANPLACAIRNLMEEREKWTGTPTELLAALEELVDERTTQYKNWPGSPVWLTRKLKRPATFLRSVGIDIDFPPPGRGLTITIRKRPKNTSSTPDTSCKSTKQEDNNDFEGKEDKEGKKHTFSNNGDDETEVPVESF